MYLKCKYMSQKDEGKTKQNKRGRPEENT